MSEPEVIETEQPKKSRFKLGDHSALDAWRKDMKENHPEEYEAHMKSVYEKSIAVRRKHKALRDQFKAVLPLVTDDEKLKAKLEELGVDNSYEMAMTLSVIRKAQEGDIEANRYIRDTIGEKPTENYNLGVTGKPIEALDLSQLTDEELEALATADD